VILRAGCFDEGKAGPKPHPLVGRDLRDLEAVVGDVALDLGGVLSTRAAARKAGSGLGGLAIDRGAPGIQPGAFALGAGSGSVGGVRKVIHRRGPRFRPGNPS
jgi:hypothetical protein